MGLIWQDLSRMDAAQGFGKMTDLGDSWIFTWKSAGTYGARAQKQH